MRRRDHKKESGQAMIEFLIVICIILTFTFVFVQLSWAIAYGHYAHYATYMASRAYLSGGVTQQDQFEAAAEVLRKMLKQSTGADILPSMAKARKGDERDIPGTEAVQGAFIGMHPQAEGQEKSRYYSWAEGVQYNFNVPIYILPLASFVAKDGLGNTIQPGSTTNPAKAIEWKGAIPFTSDSFLGREPSFDECFKEMTRISSAFGFARPDGAEFIEDNGC